MLFNSVSFLIFFPVVTILYFIIPHKARWIWLLIASYFFYMSWNPAYALLMASSTVITYVSGLLIERSHKISDEKTRVLQCKTWVALSFIINLSILLFFKYFGFFIDNINQILSLIGVQAVVPAFDVLLPVGISFYTFQALSYTMDVYRGDIYAEKNLGKYALFVSFFPQLVAGPIERSKNLLKQIDEHHKFEYDRVKNGLLLMVWGYFQKIVIADNVSIIVNRVYNNHTKYAGSQILVATVLFAVQIYCDFSGYTDIAKGAAQVMGFRLMDNFRQPYFATSIQDFWRRWHISLSTWFRDYLYIPLGGNRGSRLKVNLNIMITFLVSGLWHGASWSFVIWGGLHGLYQVVGNILKPVRDRVVEKLKLNRQSFLYRVSQTTFVFIIVDFAWIFFRAPDLRTSLSIVGRIFTDFRYYRVFEITYYAGNFGKYSIIIIAFIIAMLLVCNIIQIKYVVRNEISKYPPIVRWFSYYVIILLLVILSVYGSNQFIYFQF